MKRRLAAALAAFLLLPVWLSGCGSSALDKEPDQWRLRDFEGCFDEQFDTTTEEYRLLEGTQEENIVQVLHGAQDGPVIYIVAGLHGDETAGWRAGDLIKEATLKAGTLYILSPANRYGAQAEQRKTKSERDINRNFPGEAEGWDAQRIAWSIYTDIQDKKPALVLDLHEAQSGRSDRDSLGNSLICQSLDGIGELILQAVLDSEAGTLCASPLTLYGSPPSGSLNRTVTEQLAIPVITVETYREEPIAQRVGNHLAFAEYVLNFYGLR